MPVCLQHPDQKATAACRTCGKPLCGACGVRAGRHLFCSGDCALRNRPAGNDAAAPPKILLVIAGAGLALSLAAGLALLLLVA